MAKIGLPKGSGKRLKVSEKSGNFEMDIEWQPCTMAPSGLRLYLIYLVTGLFDYSFTSRSWWELLPRTS